MNGWEPSEVAFENNTLFHLTTDLNAGLQFGITMVSVGVLEDGLYAVKNIQLMPGIEVFNVEYPENVGKYNSTILAFNQPLKPDNPGAITALVCNEEPEKEIYAFDPESFYPTINISNHPGEDTNPRLFYRIMSYRDYLYCIWESRRNGHWTLAYSQMELPVGLSENKETIGGKPTIKPNPISQHAIINYSLATAGKVSIDVYNPNGMHIANLLNERKQPGEHALNWNKQEYQLPAGVYIITLKTAQEKISQKVVIR